MAITTPFRFARINRWVYKPSWGHLVTHNVPFQDGYSGTIEFTIKAEEDLIVAGPKTSASSAPSESYPFQLPDGTFAIPSSSLQGMIRSVLDIATFGKLGPFVQDRRFAVRDISGRSATAKQIYQGRMAEGGGTEFNGFRPKAKTGWLIKLRDGVHIIPCEMARISYNDIQAVIRLPDTNSRTGFGSITPQVLNSLKLDKADADERYQKITGTAKNLDVLNVKVSIQTPGFSKIPPESDERHEAYLNRRGDQVGGKYLRYTRCVAVTAASPAVEGTLVITGRSAKVLKTYADGHPQYEPHNRMKEKPDHMRGNKSLEFVFHSPNRQKAIGPLYIQSAKLIPPDVLRDFLLIHEPETGKNAEVNPNWGFWKPEFVANRPVPVFYLEEETVDNRPVISAIGTAQMFKLAMNLSTHDLLRNSTTAHTSEAKNKEQDPTWGDFDLSSLIFGATGGASDSYFEKSLKGRASFDFAKAINSRPDQEIKLAPEISATLLSPKPSYYPIYVRQRNRDTGGQVVALHPQKAQNIESVYSTYNIMTEFAQIDETAPELSGIKIWPAVGRIDQPAPEADENGKINLGVQTKIHPLPKGTEFLGSVRVHNLRKFELGALLWALTLGNPEGTSARHHRLGGGKPFGLGAVSIRDVKLNLHANSEKYDDPQLSELIFNFTKLMDDFTKKAPANQQVDWQNTPQVKALLKASSPSVGTQDYEYMRIGSQKAAGTFVGEKAHRGFLPDFAERPYKEFRRGTGIKAQGNTGVVANASVPARDNQFMPTLDANYAARANPPAAHATYPMPDKFHIGQKVRAGNQLCWIIGYPRSCVPRMQQGQNLKWIVGWLTDQGTSINREVIQNNIIAAPE